MTEINNLHMTLPTVAGQQSRDTTLPTVTGHRSIVTGDQSWYQSKSKYSGSDCGHDVWGHCMVVDVVKARNKCSCSRSGTRENGLLKNEMFKGRYYQEYYRLRRLMSHLQLCKYCLENSFIASSDAYCKCKTILVNW